MNHELLRYIWLTQQFDIQSLTLDNGSTFQIIFPGHYNNDNHPCFLNAKIRIDQTIWVGSVTINITIADLVKYQQQYIDDHELLHVVWEDDQPELTMPIPVLTLKNWITPNDMARVQHYFNLDSILAWSNADGDLPKRNSEQSFNIKANINEQLNDDEIQLFNCLNLILDNLKKKAPLIRGKIRTIKTLESCRQVGYGTRYTHAPKLLLLGNWLNDAGFNSNEKVRIIPFNNILIIVPDKKM